MLLQLSARLAYANGATQVVEHVFDRQGGTLGRDPRCQMVLPDPFRRISRIQAQVIVEDGRFILLNASTTNAIYVDDRELRPGEICPVETGATWVTGNHTIVVEGLSYEAQGPSADAEVIVAAAAGPAAPELEQVQPSPACTVAPATPPQPALAAATEQRDAPGAQVATTAPSTPSVPAGPFEDLLSTPLPEGAYQAAAGAIPEALPDAPPQASSPGLPLPISPMALASETPVPAAAVVGFIGADPFADLLATPVSEPDALAVQGMTFQSATVIPEDFNVLAPNGAPERNTDDPLAQIESAEDLPQMFPGQSMDAIYQPGDADIAVMVQDPLASKQHQRLMDASTPVDPLKMFAASPQSGILEVDATAPGQALDADQAIGDHRVEVGSYFRAPRAFVENADRRIPSAESASPVPPNAEASAAPSDQLPLDETSADHQQLISSEILPGEPDGGAALPPAPYSADVGDYRDGGRAEPHAPAVVPAPAEPIPPAQAVTASINPPKIQPEAAQHAPPTSAEASTQALLDSFKRGAGLTDCRYPEQLTPELMFMLGKMLSESVQGCMDLLGARAAAKQEVRVSVTLINAEANNPLKFLPTGSSVLAQVFGPRMPGFLDGPRAIADAFQDLRSHEVAMMAGTQAAVRGLFERFDPRYLEEQLQGQGRAKAFFSSQRDARLWALYRSRYDWLKDEIKSQSPAAWGAEFLSAYQAEVQHSSESKSI
ncbi:type VI secretion system-associated FHA domain protein TagH [Comamonas piscis]|uniref:Type VI secretion system-associated FHA domain protein TagH n=1 Tax=Comamonas piscis TaxID=1562974 RepID=A0A7G5EIK4_9BURK|nr:type VI secretion system-associated FHA domain protein TagH [Comamonas piscis]QMV73829.1 type VI secretion system-associated FHA domain protein TagH [Comamonas piscis]WSO32253.1 type VI secretion system-associated FHA domain protein TagH [Comamonas piscis]